ncbi:MAG: hypothetical protein ACPH94_05265, partial [Flavobacteriaceae bacterium]
MEDWILRNNTQQDWISLVFLFNFILFTALGSSNKNEFKYFIRFFDSWEGVNIGPKEDKMGIRSS